MNRLGWTVEQRAALRWYMAFITVVTVLGIVLSIGLIVAGNARGWGLLAFVVLFSGGVQIWYRSMRSQQP